MATEMACARVRVLLEQFVDGDLDADRAKAVQDHLATCNDCRRQHEQAISLPFRLKALTSPPPRATLTSDVMRAIAPQRVASASAWAPLAPEAVLVAFILWYLSGLDGLGSIAGGIFSDLQGLAFGSVPTIPPVDVLLLIALIALTAIAAYHLSILIRIAPGTMPTRRGA